MNKKLLYLAAAITATAAVTRIYLSALSTTTQAQKNLIEIFNITAVGGAATTMFLLRKDRKIKESNRQQEEG